MDNRWKNCNMGILLKVKAVNEIVASTETGTMHIGVTINWFCADRMQPVVPYEQAIPEWSDILEGDRVDDRQLSYYNTAAAYVDQYFTMNEAQILCEYLTTHHASEIVLEELELPLSEADVPFTSIPGEGEAGNGYGFIELPDCPDFPLPFIVRGYFDTKYATTLERYQIAVTRALTNFQCPTVGEDANNFQEMANDFKKRLVDLHDSLVNLRNVIEMLYGGVASQPQTDEIIDQKPKNDSM